MIKLFFFSIFFLIFSTPSSFLPLMISKPNLEKRCISLYSYPKIGDVIFAPYHNLNGKRIGQLISIFLYISFYKYKKITFNKVISYINTFECIVLYVLPYHNPIYFYFHSIIYISLQI